MTDAPCAARRRQPITGQKERKMPAKPQAQNEEKNGLAAQAAAQRLRSTF
jgi:hypothetical protein